MFCPRIGGGGGGWVYSGRIDWEDLHLRGDFDIYAMLLSPNLTRPQSWKIGWNWKLGSSTILEVTWRNLFVEICIQCLWSPDVEVRHILDTQGRKNWLWKPENENFLKLATFPTLHGKKRCRTTAIFQNYESRCKLTTTNKILLNSEAIYT